MRDLSLHSKTRGTPEGCPVFLSAIVRAAAHCAASMEAVRKMNFTLPLSVVKPR